MLSSSQGEYWWLYIDDSNTILNSLLHLHFLNVSPSSFSRFCDHCKTRNQQFIIAKYFCNAAYFLLCRITRLLQNKPKLLPVLPDKREGTRLLHIFLIFNLIFPFTCLLYFGIKAIYFHIAYKETPVPREPCKVNPKSCSNVDLKCTPLLQTVFSSVCGILAGLLVRRIS